MALTPNSEAKNSTELMNKLIARRRVAVVHDWMFSRRGGEKVLENILDLFPKAELFILFGNPETVLQTKHSHKINKSFLAAVPKIEKIYKLLLPLYPVAAESHDLSAFDLVISSSSCTAKGVIPPPQAIHVSYLHSPMRYAWDLENTYFPRRPGLFGPRDLAALCRKIILSFLRIWDVASAKRVDRFCANSAFVARRAKLYYGRTAEVIYPPVALEQFFAARRLRQKKQTTVLLFGAWVPYKKMDLALRLLAEKKVRVIAAGQGNQLRSLQAEYSGNDTVEFVDSPSDADVVELFKRSHVLAFPGVEDFGLVPVEAMAAGVWVVGPAAGGTLETILPERTGFHFAPGDFHGMLACIDRALALESPEFGEEIEQHLKKFAPETFREKFAELLVRLLDESGTNKALPCVTSNGAKTHEA